MKRFKNGYTVASEEVNMMHLGIPQLLVMFVVFALSAVVLILACSTALPEGDFRRGLGY